MAQKQQSVNVQDELAQLRAEQKQCILRAKRLSQQHDRAWKEEIMTLAQILERQYVLLGQQWLIGTICAEIGRLYRQHDILIWQIVDRYLPARFKEQEQQQSSGNSETSVSELLEQSSLKLLQQLYKNLPSISPIGLRELVEATDKFSKAGRKRSALERIALSPDDNASFTDQINDGKEDDREPVTIDRPVPHGSLMFDAIAKKIARWQSIQQRVFEFPPEILENDKRLADALEMADVWMDPILDLKYSKCLPDWLKAESYRDVYGKHAAGVMSYSVTNLCANCSDEKTKEWVRMEPRYAISHSIFECFQCGHKVQTVCPSCTLPMRELSKPQIGWVCAECEGTEALRRNLTREQIGDKSSIIMEIAEKFLAKIPDAAAFSNWYRDWLEERVSGRKSRLSLDLSERA